MTSRALSLIVLVTVPYAYGGIAMLAAGVSKVNVLADSRFSLRKFYLLMGWAPLVFATLAVVVDPRYLALFVVGGLAGVAGELLVSLLWRGFFREPIWTYSYGAAAGGYTSTLNFLPWAIGALIFHETGRVIGWALPSPSPVRPMLVAGGALAVGLVAAWPLRRLTSAREGAFSGAAFAVFCAPIAVAAAALALVCDPRYLLLMAVFGIVGSLTEYGYGRSMSVFFERGLWTYNHGKIDGGHTSWVTLPLWSLGGLYFHLLAACLGLR